MAKKRNTEARWIESRQRWQINVTGEDGERKTFVSSKAGRKGKLEAERKADEWLEDGSRENIRMEEAWERFIADKKSSVGTSWLTQLKNIYHVWIEPEVGKKKLSRITPAEWQRCITAAHNAGRARKTLLDIRVAITTFFSWCDANRVRADSPKKLTIPNGAPVGKRKILSNQDIKTLFTDDRIVASGKEQKAFYIHAWRLIVILGLRRGELAGLKRTDIDDNGVLHIQRSINRFGEITNGKTENARRDILLPAHALRVIEDQKAMLKSLGIATRTWLFPAPDGGQMMPEAMYKQWQRYRDQHGIKSTLHELRHTTVSLVKTELPEDLLKQMIGHSESMDTGVYKHEVEGDLEIASKIVEGVFAKIL